MGKDMTLSSLERYQEVRPFILHMITTIIISSLPQFFTTSIQEGRQEMADQLLATISRRREKVNIMII